MSKPIDEWSTMRVLKLAMLLTDSNEFAIPQDEMLEFNMMFAQDDDLLPEEVYRTIPEEDRALYKEKWAA